MSEQSRNKPRGKQPVSRHPLFPPIVGLWGAVLFGLAGLVVTPSAAPALVLAVLGAAIGLVVARQIARPKAVLSDSAAPVGNRPEASADADKPGDLWSELRTSRLALATSPEAEPAPEPAPTPAPPFLDRAPQILDLAAVEIDTAEGEVIEHQPFEMEPAVEPAPQPEAVSDAEPSAADRIAGTDLSELSHVELLERLALSLQRRGANVPAAAPATGLPETHETAAAPPAPQPEPEPEPAIIFPARAERQATVTAPAAPAATQAKSTEETLRNALAALHRMSGAA